MERQLERCIQHRHPLVVDTRPVAVVIQLHFAARQNNFDGHCHSTSGFEEPRIQEVAVDCYRRNMAVVQYTAPVHDLQELPSLYHERGQLQRGGVYVQ